MKKVVSIEKAGISKQIRTACFGIYAQKLYLYIDMVDNFVYI